jgi:hypothetical protein
MLTSCQRDPVAETGPDTSNIADAHLESVLRGMTLDELETVQGILHELLRAGLPSIERVAQSIEFLGADVAGWLRFRQPHDEPVKVVMLLGALAVAIAWMTYRHIPAPQHRLQDAIATVRGDHVYMLPIPRSDPCFCGSGGRFKACHGRVPTASPMASSARP